MIPLLAITTLNQPENFKKIIESIDYPIKKVSVLCNSYSIDYLLKIREFCKSNFVQEFIVSHCPYNMGCSTSWNYHIKMNPECDHWIFSGDDVIFSDGDLERAKTSSEVYDVSFCSMKTKYSLFSLSKKCVDIVGFFDENIHPANFEDDDYDRRIRKNRLNVGLFEFNGTHFGSGTTYNLSEENKSKIKNYYKMNEIYYTLKVEKEDYTSGKFDFVERSKKLLIVK
jgi:hypothetical protein